MFNFNPAANNQLINKLSNPGNIVQDLKKYRKKDQIQCQIFCHQLIFFTSTYINREQEIYEHQLPDIEEYINHSYYLFSGIPQTYKFLNSLHKFLERKYDLTQAQLRTMRIYKKILYQRQKRQVVTRSTIQNMLRIINASWQRSQNFHASLQLLQEMLQSKFITPSTFTIIQLICEQKSLEMLYLLALRIGSSMHYKAITNLVVKHLQKLNQKYKTLKQYQAQVKKEQDDYIFEQLEKFMMKACLVLNQRDQGIQNFDSALQYFYSLKSYYPHCWNQSIPKLYKNTQLQEIQIEMTQNAKYISKYLHQFKILRVALTKSNNCCQYQYYQPYILAILMLMVNSITYVEFKQQVIPFFKRFLQNSHHIQVDKERYAMIILLFLLSKTNSEQEDHPEINLFDVFCNSNFSQVIFQQIRNLYNAQCGNRYYFDQKLKKSMKLTNNNLLYFTIIGYQLIDKCRISVHNSQYVMLPDLVKAETLLKQNSQPWIVQVLDKLSSRLKKQVSYQSDKDLIIM